MENLVQLLRTRATLQPDRIAYQFLADGERPAESLTCAELDRRARAVAAWLQAEGGAGERVLLLYRPCLEFIVGFCGCLYAGAIAIPAYPPRQNRHLLRLEAIVADAGARFGLTSGKVIGSLERGSDGEPGLKSLRLFATDRITPGLEDGWAAPVVTPDSLAFLQYTSGSTGAPKGVMVTHGNLLHNLELLRNRWGYTEESLSLSWAPFFHDMGLIAGVLAPLYAGIPAVLFAPAAFLQRPARWLEAISKYRATISIAPNFAYDLAARRVTSAEREALDLRCWKATINGAEPVRQATIARFTETFADAGFAPEVMMPAYGLAEATLCVSSKPQAGKPAFLTVSKAELEQGRAIPAAAAGPGTIELVGCGPPCDGQRVVIVDPERRAPCAGGQIGEIWVSGPSVTRGYWQRPELTEATFGARLASDGEGPFLRTGDLGFLHDGELYVTGRLKDLIIIRGRNLYPQDIEQTAEEAHPALRQAYSAAFAVDVCGTERLVVVLEVQRPMADYTEILTAVRVAVASEHEVMPYALVLIEPGAIPKTSSGKIQRRATREAFLSGELAVLASSIAEEEAEAVPLLQRDELLALSPDEIAGLLRERVARLTGQAAEAIDAQAPLAALGLDSLGAVALAADLEAGLGLPVEMAELLGETSLTGLVDRVRSLLCDATVPATGPDEVQLPADSGLPVSPGQKALWFVHQLAPESSAYNLSIALRVRGQLNAGAMKQAFQALVDRHWALRTTFAATGGEPVQVVAPHADVSFAEQLATDWTDRELQDWLSAEAQRPFDLTAGPLLRVALLRRGPAEHVLLLCLHHIVSDLWSLAVLLGELGRLYAAADAGRPLTDLLPAPLQYGTYVKRQAAKLGARTEELRRYWAEALAGELPVLNLPTDWPRPPVQTYDGATQSLRLGAELSHQLKQLSREAGTTLYMTLLAAFAVLLHRYTGQAEVLIASPTVGRAGAGLGDVVGYCVNPVVMRTDCAGDPTFADLLARVRSVVLGALAHQEYPFPWLVEQLQPVRDPARPPLVQAMFVLEKAPDLGTGDITALALGAGGAPVRVGGGLVLEALPVEQHAAQFDLVLAMGEVDGELVAALDYNSDLFEAATAGRMLSHLQTLLTAAARDPHQAVSRLPLLTDVARRQQIKPTAPALLERCCHELLAEQALRTPGAVALTSPDGVLTYAELDRRANALAHRLCSLGAGPGTVVGLCAERSPDLLVGLFGILKAGAAFLPLDPAYPLERLDYMLADAGVQLLCTQAQLVERLPASGRQIIFMDAGVAGQPPSTGVTPEDLAYVIYTSGSTGAPKGVMVAHRSVVNLVTCYAELARLNPADRVLQFISISFDPAVKEILSALARGAALVLAPPAVTTDPAALNRLIAGERITVLTLPAAYWHEWVRETARAQAPLPDCLRLVSVGGERPLPEVYRLWVELSGGRIAFANEYGPTEATIAATIYLEEGSSLTTLERGGIPAGRPVANVQVYVLDGHLEPVPPGVTGELYIGGCGVARGYLGRPERTAERFLPDPFSGQPGARLYRSGDMARVRSDGLLEILGRRDDQIKLRGYRVELGEIEAVLRRHPAVAEAVVTARNEGAHLAAYVVPKQGAVAGPGELHSFLAGRLPGYMVPSAWMTLPGLPLTPAGKVDRAALPAPARSDHSTAHDVPATPAEAAVAAIWAELLGLDRVVGRRENFFRLGGHSLLAPRLLARVAERLGAEVSLAAFWADPTVAGLAAAARQARPEAAITVDAAAAAIDVDGLPDEAVATLLAQMLQTEGDQT